MAQLEQILELLKCGGMSPGQTMGYIGQLLALRLSSNPYSILRNMDVTSTFTSLPDVVGKLISIKNRTGGILTIRRAVDTDSSNDNMIEDGEDVAYYVDLNANELEVSSGNDGRIEIVID